MFTDAEKAEISSLRDEGFTSFMERVIFYKTPSTTYLSSAGANFNFAFGNQQPDAQIQYVTNSGEFFATVQYIDQLDSQQLAFIPANAQISKRQGFARISVSGDEARGYLEDSEKIVLDGKDFRRVTDVMPRGIFVRNYYDCWVQKIDNG